MKAMQENREEEIENAIKEAIETLKPQIAAEMQINSNEDDSLSRA